MKGLLKFLETLIKLHKGRKKDNEKELNINLD